ncbi:MULTISPECIES: DUF7507 domain-containing protein [Streptosporangium]|uniref:Repeat protein (TIGR01451 family) n=1 Tax=Streptosporangium brasiliense TaxID=47480 RepID=A0ABT9R397_9ACTN|nr:hypothetical protein [Streptosporangium brasiliense]MDP9863718.1 putative repeat protein (TIGR01451 family) [Streptosporangium brasiliense]
MMRHIRRMCYPVAALAMLTAPLTLLSVPQADAARIDPAQAALRATPDPASCPGRVALVNGGFERPVVTGGAVGFFPDASQNGVPGWLTTATDRQIELWTGPPNPTNAAPAEGRQFAELNANQVSTLYQDHPTTPGAKLYWRLSHRGRLGVDTMSLDIGAPGSPAPQKVVSDGATGWGAYAGTYTVPAGQTTTRFAFRSISSAGGNQGIGNFLDDVFFGTAPCVVVTKAAIPVGPVDVGDVITYRLTARNEGGAAAEKVRLTDAVPAGTSYVPGSLRVVDGPDAGAKTDQPGDDQGDFDPVAGKVSFSLGDGATGSAPGRLPNTADLPGGTTVEFQVKVDRAAAGKQITNQGTVGYENQLGSTPEPLTSTSGETLTKVNPAVDLSLVKSADLTRATVGQTVTYRLAVRNAGPNDATGVTVKDVLPPGLAFVSATPSAGAYDPGTGTWTVGALAKGGTVTLTIHAKAVSVGTKTNTATVGGDQKDLDPANDTDTVKICVDPVPACADCDSTRCPSCTPRNKG